MFSTKKSKKLASKIIAISVIAAIGLSGCGSKAVTSSTSSDKKELIPIKTWTKVDCSSTPWVVADKKGFFAEEGLKLVYTGQIQPQQEIPSILNGNNDFGSYHPNTFAVAKAGGAPLVGISTGGIEPDASVDPKFRHMWWFVNPKSGIKTWKDLINYKKGEKLKFSTITNNICADFLANKISDKNGLARDRIEWVSMPDIQAIQALAQGQLDVAGVHPPYYKGMLDSGAVKIDDTSDADLGQAAGLTFYVVTEDFAKKNPETVKKFVKAMTKAQKWANENYVEAGKLTSEAIKAPVNGYHYYSTSSKIDENLIKPWIDDLESKKVIPKGVVTTSNLITHKFEDPNDK